MATREFDVTLQLEGQYEGDRWWSGEQIHSTWNVENLNTSDRSVWGVDANGWVQYRSTFGSYAIRYNTLDQSLSDYYFETELQPSGSGNYEVGTAFRFKDRNTFYYLVYNGGYQDWSGKNIRLMKVSAGVHTKMAEYTIPVFVRTQTYKFRVELAGGKIRVVLDGVEIFNFTDPNPILKGAFGPIVKGQEFAKWRGFQAKSVSSFLLQKSLKNNSVTSDNYDAASSKLISPSSVMQLMQSDVDAFFANKPYESRSYDKFTITSANSVIKPIFDRIAEKNVTNDEAAKIYAYQTLPTSPPLNPTNLQGQALSSSEITLKWTHADASEDGFYIMDADDRIIGTVGENVYEFTESGLTEGTTYSRHIVAFNTAGNSTPSNKIVVTTKQTLPAAPSDFNGSALSDQQIKWTWKDNSFNENQFEIVALDASGNITVIASVDAGVTEYIEKGLTFLTDYTRMVRAKNTAGLSALSDPMTVKTKDWLPSPPKFAPVNFYGVGVAGDSIVWSWEDINLDSLGFELLDDKDQVIQTIPKQYSFAETGLYSKMHYARKLRAYNKGGFGPSTVLATAFTLGYGYDYTDHPVEPFNLMDMDITATSVLLDWDYFNDDNMPAIGFKIFNDLDMLVDTIPLGITERRVDGLLPGQTYTFYVVAYNEIGDSLPSNAITIVTDSEDLNEEPEPDDNDTDDWEDTMAGLVYDHETVDTGKIPAFQSGVGDSMDLVVKNLFNEMPNFEEFVYDMCIKGYYQDDVSYYPEVSFQFQVTCKGIDPENSTPFVKKSDWFTAMVQGSNNGREITFASSLSMALPPTITSKKFSVEVRDMDGNPIDPYAPNKPEQIVNWVLDPYESKEMVGIVENIYMKNVYQDWRKFSHQGTAQPSNVAEMDAWKYNEETNEIVCTLNTGTLVGAISPDAYDNFVVETSFRSDNADDDSMGFVIAFALDASGREHTLTAIRAHSLTNKWALYYNFRQSNEIVLAIDKEFNKLDPDGNWGAIYPKGTSIKVSRHGDVIEAWSTIAAQDEYGWKLGVNLNDYPELAIFKGPQAVGVTSWSQNGAALKIQKFRGEKTEQYTSYNIRAWTTHSENKGEYKEWSSALFISEVKRVNAFEELKFTGRIQAPQYQIPWQEINKKYKFDPSKYKLVINCSNPNVELKTKNVDIDFFPEDSTFVSVDMTAKVINHTQTSWHPHVHHGYYYLNQQEHYLFSDDKVLPRREDSTPTYVYTFPYVIKAYAERNYEGGKITFTDETAMNFLVGKLSEGIDVDANENVLTLTESAKEGVFESRLFFFENEITELDPVIVNDINPDGTPVQVEVGAADKYGVVTTWQQQIKDTPTILSEPAEQVRYRLSLKQGTKAEPFLMDFSMNNNILGQGYGQYVTIEDTLIRINDPEFRPTGTYLTKPLEYGKLVSDMGTVTLDLSTPNNTLVELYSVSASDAAHDFKNPTSASPWIPLELVGKVGSRCTYRIKSSKNPWVVIVAKLHRGMTEQPSVPPIVINASTFDTTLATNLWKVADTIKLMDSSKEGIYQSKAINVGNAEFFSPTAPSWTNRNPSDRLSIYTITGDDPFDLAEKAKIDDNWQAVSSSGVINSLPKKWFMYRIVVQSGDGLTGPELNSIIFKPTEKIYISPTISNMIIQARLFNWVATYPRVKSVQVSATIEPGFGAEDYLVPMTGKLVSGGEIQDVTAERTDKVVLDWLHSQGVASLDTLVLKDFLVEVDPIYPVELYTDSTGVTKVTGKTTAPVGDLVWKQEKLYFDEKSAEIVLQPIPQTGSPLIVQNAQGRQLRQVHFRTALGYPTLSNVQDTQTNDSRYIFLEYAEVDPTTMQVFIDLTHDGKYEEVFNCRLEENRIILPIQYPPRLNVRLTYKLKDSFFVDYNYDPSSDYAKIGVHTSYDPEVKETRQLIVKYEVNKEHAYHLLSEVDLNPLHGKINSGFLYLTDEIYEPYKLDVYANPTVLYRNKEDRVTVNAYVLDEFNNPVVGERVSFSANHGEITVQLGVSDENGMVTATYKSIKDSVEAEDIIEINVLGRTTSSHLSKQVKISLVDESFVDKLAIVPEKRTASDGDVVQLKVIAIGPSNERLVNRKIDLSTNVGSIAPSSGMTNPDGELFVILAVPDEPLANFITLEARTTTSTGKVVQEQNILGISGV